MKGLSKQGSDRYDQPAAFPVGPGPDPNPGNANELRRRKGRDVLADVKGRSESRETLVDGYELDQAFESD